MAAKLGHKPIVTILLANGAELNSQDHFVEYPKGKQGSTPLIEATREGFMEIMQQLISKGPSLSFYPEYISILFVFYPNFIPIQSG